MAAKKSAKGDRKPAKAAVLDTSEMFVRQMPAMRRDDAAAWLCHTVGFDPTLLESAVVKGWVEFNPETGLYAGAAMIEKTDEGGGGSGDGGSETAPAVAGPAAGGQAAVVPSAATGAVPESVTLDLFSNPGGGV